MSKGREKAQRFGGLAAIRQQAALPEAPTPVPTAPPEQNRPEPFSSHLTAPTKRRLKQASAKEGRKQFETLEQAVVEYLNANHPDIR